MELWRISRLELCLILLQSSVIIIGEAMDGKMHRYMQRIQKIIHTPTKAANNVSPIRPTKTPLKHKPNQLDKYIKYELSVKIIHNIVSRNNQQLVMVFFNMLRNTEHRQKQKIYKFVAIQRQELRVDLGVAAKLLNAVLKQLVKKRFSQFIFNSQIDRPLEFAFKKFLQEESTNNNAGQLMRTTSLKSKAPQKQPTEWFEDMETQNQKKHLMQKIDRLRGYTGKVIIKHVQQSCNKLLKKAFQNIRWHVIQSSNLKFQQNASKTMQKQVKIWQQKEKNYLSQIHQLSQKLAKCQSLLLKQSTTKLNESAKHKPEETKNSNIKPDNCFNNFYCLINRKTDKEKYCLLQQIHTLFVYAGNNKRIAAHLSIQSAQLQVKTQNNIKGLYRLNNLVNKIQKSALQHIKQASAVIPRLRDASNLLFEVLRVADKKRLQYSFLFFQRLCQTKTIEKPSQKYDFLRLHNEVEQRSTSSRNIDNKSNIKISVFSNSQTITPRPKPNFHLFVDKIFKLILIISKLLIPLKQGFDKINQYALYSYQIEEKLKFVALKNLRHSFERIHQYTKNDDSRILLLQKLSVLEGVVRERLVESFSHIKIISKENDLKIKLIPVKLHIVETTKQFIEQRKMYSQYSLQNWSKLRENLLQDVKSSNLEKEKKKRITSTI